MTDTSYALLLRNLSSDYYHGHINFEDYRAQRNRILDEIDAELNADSQQQEPLPEPEPASLLMQTISFFKNKDVEK